MSDEANDPARETARRARAIWGYSMLQQKELAERAGINHPRLRKLLAPTNPEEATPEEMRSLASAVAEVPASFASAGFEPSDTESSIARLWQEFDYLSRRVDENTAGLSTLSSIVDDLRRGIEAARRRRRGGSR